MSSPEEKAYEIMRELDVNYVLVIFGGLTGYASDGGSPWWSVLGIATVSWSLSHVFFPLFPLPSSLCPPSLPPSQLFVLPPFHLPLDINKFLWMVRIGGSTEKGQHIKEADYFTPQGEFRVDREGSPILLNCLMYKMCYYRFGQVYTEQGQWSWENAWSFMHVTLTPIPIWSGNKTIMHMTRVASSCQRSCMWLVIHWNKCLIFVICRSGKPSGYDRVRNAEIGNKVCTSLHWLSYVWLAMNCMVKFFPPQDFELDVLEEAYTTEHWIVRIYKVKDLENRGIWNFSRKPNLLFGDRLWLYMKINFWSDSFFARMHHVRLHMRNKIAV